MTKEEAISILRNAAFLSTETQYQSTVEAVEIAVKALREERKTISDEKYEYHYDHTDCIWYRPESRNRCPTTCAQYRDGWNDAMNYIFRDGKGYRPYRRDEKYEG